MNQAEELITGEFRRVYDDRYRIALPPELTDLLVGDSAECVLAKEREGCLSLWNADVWKSKIEGGQELIKQRLKMHLLDRDLAKVQQFSRLLSTRSRPVKLAQRGRLLVPEGFREFLAVEPDSEVLIVGAGVCIEIWNPPVWHAYLREDIGNFQSLFAQLMGT